MSIMYLLGSLLSLAKYMSRNHSPRSAWRCCVKLRWELEKMARRKKKRRAKRSSRVMSGTVVNALGVVLGRQISPFVNIYCSVFALFMRKTLDIQLRPKCSPHSKQLALYCRLNMLVTQAVILKVCMGHLSPSFFFYCKDYFFRVTSDAKLSFHNFL